MKQLTRPEPIRLDKYHEPQTLAEATVGLTLMTDGRFLVTLRLPAGMDIAPEAWRFYQEEAAWKRFTSCTDYLASHGFTCVQSINTR